MISLFSWLITMLAGMFWFFRMVVTFMATIGKDMIIIPTNTNMEIALLFITLIALVLIIKRNMLGAFIYLVSYGAYFGMDVVNSILRIKAQGAGIAESTALMVSFMGVVLAVLVFFDILFNKNRKGSVKDKKTDWFYTNKDFERNYDERADRNQYKF